MATTGTISVLKADGSVASIYSHWDNYPDWNGKLLLKHYNTQELAEQLVSLGNISSLGKRIEPTPDALHNFETPERGTTVYYGRDRGEDDQEPCIYWGVEMFRKSGRHEQYNYLFKDGQWYLMSGRNSLTLVSEVLAINEAEDHV